MSEQLHEVGRAAARLKVRLPPGFSGGSARVIAPSTGSSRRQTPYNPRNNVLRSTNTAQFGKRACQESHEVATRQARLRQAGIRTISVPASWMPVRSGSSLEGDSEVLSHAGNIPVRRAARSRIAGTLLYRSLCRN